MNNNLLIEHFETRSEETRRLEAAQDLKTRIRRVNQRDYYIKWRAEMERLARSFQPVVRAKLLRAAARRHAIERVRASATRIQVILPPRFRTACCLSSL